MNEFEDCVNHARQNTGNADRHIATISDLTIRESLELLSGAIDSIIDAVEQLENTVGESPTIEVDNLKDTVRGLESRIESLERDNE